jgi:hypothetical protein
MSRYFHQAPWWETISWTPKWTKHHSFSEYGLVCCTSDWNLLCLKNMLLCQKSYLCKISLMLYDSNGFKPYICFDFHNLSMYHTHTHSYTHSLTHPHIHIFYWHYAKIRWILSFWAISKVSGTADAVFIGHVQPQARHVRVLGFSLYKGAEYPFEP